MKTKYVIKSLIIFQHYPITIIIKCIRYKTNMSPKYIFIFWLNYNVSSSVSNTN